MSKPAPTFVDFLRDQNRVLQDMLKRLRADNERLRAENAEQKAEMQKLYDNWSRVLRMALDGEKG